MSKTQCTTNRCGCKKQGLYCGPNCQCSDCKNNQHYVAFQVPQCLHQDVTLLQIRSEGATFATNNCAGIDPYVLQHRVQAAQQSVVRPLFAQYYGQYESPTKGCRCQKTQCTTNRCGCKKQGLYCGPNCQCSDCKNNQHYVAFQVPQCLHQDVTLLQIRSEGATFATNNCAGIDPYVLQHRVQAAQQSVVRPSPAQYYGQYESPTKGCRCQKTQCTTNRCGCNKQGLYCGPNCGVVTVKTVNSMQHSKYHNIS